MFPKLTVLWLPIFVVLSINLEMCYQFIIIHKLDSVLHRVLSPSSSGLLCVAGPIQGEKICSRATLAFSI